MDMIFQAENPGRFEYSEVQYVEMWVNYNQTLRYTS